MIRTYDHQRDDWRAPPVPDRATLVYCEPGRVHDRKTDGGRHDVCHRSFWYRVVLFCGAYTLLVKHGGGVETMHLCYADSPLLHVLDSLDSDGRYFLLHALREARDAGATEATARTTRRYCEAFVNGRLKKRKRRGTSTYDVRIEAAPAGQEGAA